MSVPVLKIAVDAEVTFHQRPNRFLGIIDDPDDTVNSRTEIHVHDPGRLRELLYSGNRVLVRRAENPDRKTQWDLIAARYKNQWVLVNSGFQRKIVENLFSSSRINPIPEMVSFRAEVTAGDSRLDFVGQTENKIPVAVETKGCTLAIDGVGLFPDAPTIRGARHLDNLVNLVSKGYLCRVLILIFRPDAVVFGPYRLRDPHFAECFYAAMDAGVTVQPLVFRFDGNTVHYLKQVPVLERNQI